LFCVHFVQHLARPWASKALSQRAIWIDVFFANQTLVRIRNCIQSAAAALDGFSHEHDAKRHASHYKKQKAESEYKSFHGFFLNS